ncbi:hypothetical protein [Dactylosporangium darangshiense]|uniref:Uncharacterized protein n=1 Tax=Dactylosporangium darangshiense TaxID=579108 RepID=A0ABP8DW52_9ACTN
MARVPQGRDHPIVGSGTRLERSRWRDGGTAERTDWIGSRNAAVRLVTTGRRQRFANLDAYRDLHGDTNTGTRRPPDQDRLLAAPAAVPGGVRHIEVVTDLEMGSGPALAVGVLLTSVSILALAIICGWALLPGQ